MTTKHQPPFLSAVETLAEENKRVRDALKDITLLYERSMEREKELHDEIEKYLSLNEKALNPDNCK